MSTHRRAQIITILKSAGGVVSGETISTRLGISRTAVWKQIRGLREMGYPITATPTGYVLSPSADALFPWEFPQWESLIHYTGVTDSTMNDARRLARDGCPHFSLALSEQQTGGRGRLQRHWVSPAGGLFFTLVLRPALPPALSFRCTFAASYELALAIEAVTGVHARVKWPNDLLVEEAKICGMLSEMETESDMVRFLNIGIGINVNNAPPADIPGTTSLARLIGKPVARARLLDAFLTGFHKRLGSGSLEDIVSLWKTRAVTLGRKVRVETRTTTVTGTAVDVDSVGALLVQTCDGRIETVHYGDCFHMNSAGAYPE
ncbi:MAG: biotin--[acetyl-CoA-carboxylase] ligase [Pseudomonadota bacterium]